MIDVNIKVLDLYLHDFMRRAVTKKQRYWVFLLKWPASDCVSDGQ